MKYKSVGILQQTSENTTYNVIDALLHLSKDLCLLVDIQNFSAGNGKVTDERLLSLIQAFAKAHAADI